MSDSVRPHRRQPTRLPCPWDSPGKITGVGCHFLLQCMKVKSESEVAQRCPTLRNPMDCSLPGFSMGFSRQESYSGVPLPSPQCRRPWFNSWVTKIPWRRDRLPTPLFLGFLHIEIYLRTQNIIRDKDGLFIMLGSFVLFCFVFSCCIKPWEVPLSITKGPTSVSYCLRGIYSH